MSVPAQPSGQGLGDLPGLGSVAAELPEMPEPRFSPEGLAAMLGQNRPTPQQSEIISSPLEPRLVVAGAGSGKTATMADRVVWLVANGWVRPEEVLGVTFTRKAAGELSSRIRTQLARLARLGREGSALPESAVDPESPDPSVSTYHSFANSVVQDYGLRLGTERDAVVLGAAQSWQLAATVVEAYDGEVWPGFPAKSTLIGAVMSLAGESAEHLRTGGEIAAWLSGLSMSLEALPLSEGAKGPASAVAALLAMLRSRELAARLVERFAEAKRHRGALDYGDLVALAARIAREVPEAGRLLRARYRTVLLDEFQDTSHAQAELFSELFGDGHAVMAVGDPHQSIYGFRGASAGQLAAFPERFPRMLPSGGREPSPRSRLTTAWRNAGTVLEAANLVAAPLSKAPSYQAGQRSTGVEVSGLEARPDAPDGVVRVARFSDEREEAEAVAGELRDFAAAWVPSGAGSSGPTMAVLCRKRSQFALLRRAFEEIGLPCEVVGLGGLLDAPEIIDVVSTLRVIADPARSDALMRLLAGARWRIGTADLMALADWSRHLAARRAEASTPGEQDLDADGSADETLVEGDVVEAASLIEAIDRLPRPGWVSGAGRSLGEEARRRLTRLRDELRTLRAFSGDDLGMLITQVERTLLLDIELAARPGNSLHRARRNLDAFQEAAASFLQQSSTSELLAFLAWLDAAAAEESGLEASAPEPVPGAVQLLTVHASKGLEWDAVAVPGLNHGSFPSGGNDRWTSGASAMPWPLRGDRRDLPQWDVEHEYQKGWVEAEKLFAEDAAEHAEREDRRLAYVAFTRARSLLVATGFGWSSSRSRPLGLSPFLTELHEAAESRGFQVLRWTPDEDLPEENPLRAEPERARWPYDPLEGPLRVSDGVRRSLRPGRRDAVERAAAQVLRALDQGSASEGHPAGGPPSARVEGWTVEAELLLQEEALRRVRHRVALPEHLSASTLVALAEDPEAVARQLRRPVPRRPALSARRGTAFHAWVEEYFGESAMLDLEGLDNADHHVDEAHGLAELVRAFHRTEWAGRRPAFVEVPIETRVGPVVVRGRVDAVFRDADGGWELVDWKTGRAPSAGEARSRAVQLAVYRLAWARLHGIPPEEVRVAFCYLGDGTVVRPEGLAGEEELERIISTSLG